MAMKKDEKVQVIKKNPTRHKLIVAQGRAMGTPEVPYKTLYTEIVGSKEEVKVLTDAYIMNNEYCSRQ